MAVGPNLGGIDLEFEAAKQQFFDRRSVQRSLSRGARTAMSKIGGFIRTSAKRSIKKPGATKRTQRSQPGKPPRSHTGALRNKIFFVYDEQQKRVVIGPLLWRSPRSHLAGLDYPTAAGTLEHGGRVQGPKRIKTKTPGKYLTGPTQTLRIEPRPYMRPALERAVQRAQLQEAFQYMLR